jgi:hypothetical protein
LEDIRHQQGKAAVLNTELPPAIDRVRHALPLLKQLLAFGHREQREVGSELIREYVEDRTIFNRGPHLLHRELSKTAAIGCDVQFERNHPQQVHFHHAQASSRIAAEVLGGSS